MDFYGGALGVLVIVFVNEHGYKLTLCRILSL